MNIMQQFDQSDINFLKGISGEYRSKGKDSQADKLMNIVEKMKSSVSDDE